MAEKFLLAVVPVEVGENLSSRTFQKSPSAVGCPWLPFTAEPRHQGSHVCCGNQKHGYFYKDRNMKENYFSMMTGKNMTQNKWISRDWGTTVGGRVR